MLVARRRSQSTGRAFARSEHLAFEYRCADEQPLSALDTSVLEGFTLRLLRQDKRIADTLLESPDKSEVVPGIDVTESTQSGDEELFKLRIGEEGPAVSADVGPPGSYPLPLFRWTFAITAESELPAATQGAIQHFLLLYCAHRVLEEPFLTNLDSATAPPRSGREVFAYHAPARLDHADGGIPPLEEGDRLRLSFEVPTRCTQRCVFCVAWTDCGTDEMVLTPEQLLAAAAELLTELSAAGDSVRADIVFVGQDALTHEAFPGLLRRFRSHASVQRITVVTPGTGLAKVGLAEEMAEAGLDGVILTLLGTSDDVHDRLAGKAGALADLQLSLANLTAAGLDWELNTVVLRDNQEAFPALLEYAADLGRPIRTYLYTNEPMVPPEQVARCAPDVVAFARLLEQHRDLVEANVESLHYAPLCLLPRWSWHLVSHASQSLPSPASPLPDACQGCAAIGSRCPSVSAAYVSLFGVTELRRIDDLSE